MQKDFGIWKLEDGDGLVARSVGAGRRSGEGGVCWTSYLDYLPNSTHLSKVNVKVTFVELVVL